MMSLIGVLFYYFGVQFGHDELRRPRVLFALLIISTAVIYTCIYIFTADDFVNRPVYLDMIHRLSYLIDKSTCVYLYYWVLRHHKSLCCWVRWKSSDDANLCFLVCILVYLCYMHTASVRVETHVVYSKIGRTGLALLQGLYSLTRIAGIACHLLLARVLASIADDLGEAMSTLKPLSSVCSDVERQLLRANDLVSIPLLVVHCNYFIRLLAQFAGELPSTVCYPLTLKIVIWNNVTNAYAFLLVIRSGAQTSPKLRQLRRLLRRQQLLQTQEHRQPQYVTIWNRPMLVLCQGASLGIKFASDTVLSWRNAVAFMSFCSSSAFVLFQFSLQAAARDWGGYCQSKMIH